MSIYTPLISLSKQLLASSAQTATLVYNGQDIMDPVEAGGNRSGINAEASGLIVYCNVTAIGTGTLQLVFEEYDPGSQTWVQITATTATSATGMIKLKIKPAITPVAASTSGVTIQDTLPAVWRLRTVKSDGSSWTYSLGVTLYS
jgi:hypothetical protein